MHRDGPMIQISFLGAVDTVTGSRYLVEAAGARVLVDCGLFQGPKKLRDRNWAVVPFAPASLDAVVLTHAHIDHSGYLPKLCKAGFRGRIYCTEGTRDLLRILLPDSGFLQEEEARHANQGGYSRHRPALPLYTRDDAESCLEQLTSVPGAGCLRLTAGGTTITFSGDVGRPVDPVMRAPEPLGPTDYLIVESTYGDRRHPDDSVPDALARVVNDVAEKRGVLVVPAFAVGREPSAADAMRRRLTETFGWD